MSKHQGKVAIVTGADRGIGRALATQLADAGIKLSLLSIEGAGLADAGRAIEAKGGTVITTVGDVSDRAVVEGAVARTVEQFGTVDYLLNVAGVAFFGGVAHCTEEEWDTTMNTNVKGYFLMAKSVLPHMQSAGGGVILNMSSIWGERGSSAMQAYATSKHAVEGFTKSLAIEAAPHGIKVSSLLLDKVDTGFRDRMLPHVNYSEEQKARMLSVADVAGAAWWVLDSSDRCLPSSIELTAWQFK